MKKVLSLLMILVMLAGSACAERLVLPYETFIELKDGDQIDLNDDGIPEEVYFEPVIPGENEYSEFYTLRIGDSYTVSNEAYTCFGCEPRLFAVEMFSGTFLFVSGEIDNNARVYDIYKADPWEFIGVTAYGSSLYVQAVRDTVLREENDAAAAETGNMRAGEFLPFYEEDVYADAGGQDWYYVEYESACGYVPAADVRIVDEYRCRAEADDPERQDCWTLRYVSSLQCEGDPRDLKVSDLDTFSTLIRRDGVSSPLYRRANYFIYTKDWEGWNYGRIPVFKAGVFPVPAGAYPITAGAGVYTYARREVPLYADPYSDEIIGTTQPDEEYAILFGTDENRYYIQQVFENPWETEDGKGGWFQARGEYVLEVLVDGEYLDLTNCFGGLHFGG